VAAADVFGGAFTCGHAHDIAFGVTSIYAANLKRGGVRIGRFPLVSSKAVFHGRIEAKDSSLNNQFPAAKIGDSCVHNRCSVPLNVRCPLELAAHIDGATIPLAKRGTTSVPSVSASPAAIPHRLGTFLFRRAF